MRAPYIELRQIGKTYPGVHALDRVCLAIQEGEVLGLIGENGAGKSTLMKILGGVTAPSEGSIVVGGIEHEFLTIKEAMAAGIAFVHQELNLFDNLTVAANILIGREPTGGGFLKLVDKRRQNALVQPFLDRLRCDFSADTLVKHLSIAQMQMVEIAKALSSNARIIIMDEPTSSLTISETDRLLGIVRDLKASNVGIVFITHRLAEIKAIADRVVALRDGRLVGEMARADIDHAAMIRLMVGRDLKALYTPPAGPVPAGKALTLRGLRTTAFPDTAVDLTIPAGRILGLAGLIGAGRTSLAQAIFGIDPPLAGQIEIDGQPLRIASPRQAIDHGIYLIPEDRKRAGLLLDMQVGQNITLPNLRDYATFGLLRPQSEQTSAEDQRASLRIKAHSVKVRAGTLSGGNQQKIVLAKWLAMRPRAILFDEPTRGIDVGAKAEIYALMRSLADHGVAILMISSDMEEVIGVSDRIAVMSEGRIAGFLERPDFSEQNVLHLAVGEPVAA